MDEIFAVFKSPTNHSLPSLIKQGSDWVMYKVAIQVDKGLYEEHVAENAKHKDVMQLRKKFESFMLVPNGYMVQQNVT